MNQNFFNMFNANQFMKRLAALSQQWLLLLTVLFVTCLASCERGIEPRSTSPANGARVRVNQTITEVVVGNDNFSLLRAAVVRAGLASALASGNLTVFAPTNAAFQAAGFADETAINNADLNTLRQILLYHVIGTERYFSDRIPDALSSIKTLQGEDVQVIRDQQGAVAVNGVLVSQPDLETNNGVIHVIGQVLLPPAGNTVEVAAGNPNLTYLVAALQRASQAGSDLFQLLVQETVTVFAPTNAAFQAAGFPTIASIQSADPVVLRRILTYHLVRQRFFTPQFSVGDLETINGERLTTTQTVTGATVQGVGNAAPIRIQLQNLITLRGVVHVIDQVLLPDGGAQARTVTDLVVANPNFSLLRMAVVRAGLASALASGNLTVFAPTNAAFQAAGFADETAINNADLNTLRQILLYHVIGTERYFADRLPARLTGFRTLQGEQVYAVREQRGILVNGIPVTQANVRATNGVVHVIDRVLLPPAGNLAEIAVANPNLTYLVAALQRAGLVQTIATGGPFTVFAPTNAAFQAAGFPTIASIQSADPAVLTRILTYHVLNERAFAAGLRTNAVTTIQGGQVFITASSAGVSVKGNANASPSTVVTADVLGLNGIVHVIDQVLLP